MGSLKQILLPLAIVLTAIGTFELGASYGASNVRAVALSGQLQTYLNFYTQSPSEPNITSQKTLEVIIDNHIATASLLREKWFLQIRSEPKATLDKALRNGLAIRASSVLDHMQTAVASESGMTSEKFEQIQNAVARAKSELIPE